MNGVPSMFGNASTPSSSPGNGILGGLTSSNTLAGLQAGSSAISMLGSMAAGSSQAAAYNEAAGDAAVEEQGQLVQGVGQNAGLRQSYLNTIGQRTAAAGAGGVDVGQGIASDTRNAIEGRVDTQSGINTLGSQINATKYEINRLNDLQMADLAKQQGTIGAIGGGVGLGLNLLRLV